MKSNKEIKLFEWNIAASEIEDLKLRLRAARWSQGVPLDYHREFCKDWAEEYDCFANPKRLNELSLLVTVIDGLEFHFIQVKSKHSHATPLLITDYWLLITDGGLGPGVEFHKVIEPLVSPVNHLGRPDHAL